MKIIKSNTLYQGKIINVKRFDVVFPDNQKGIREFVDHASAVAILPIDQQNIFLVKQFRIGAMNDLLEIPAGLLMENEDLESCAKRELQEEIGYYPQKITFLGSYYLSPGFSNEIIHLFVGEDLVYQPLKPDDDEFIEVIKYPLSSLSDLIKPSSSIIDAKTILAISLYLNKTNQ